MEETRYCETCSSFRNHDRRSVLSLLQVSLLFIVLHVASVHSFENDYAQRDVLSEAVKGMLDEGFSQQEIVNTLKLEIGITRIKTLIEKLNDGEQLSEEELTKMKTGEIDDDDEDLVNVLQQFGMYMLEESQGNGSTSINITDAQMNVKTKNLQTAANNYSGSGYNEGGNASTDDAEVSKENVGGAFAEDFADHKQTEPQGKENIKPKPDYAYSPYDLIQLVKVEESIYKPLKKYIEKVEAKLKILKGYVKDFDESSGQVSNPFDPTSTIGERAKAIVSNPLASFKMIRRFAFKIPDVWTTVGEDLEEELWEALSKVRMKNQPPNEQDWKESIETLFRIQYYNGYQAKQFAKGSFGLIQSKVKLTAEECMEIGLRALAMKYHDFALEWLSLAKNKHINEEDKSEIDLEFLEQSLQYAITAHNKAWEGKPTSADSHIYIKRLTNPMDIDTAKKQATVRREAAKELRHNEEYGYHVAYNFVSLCAGENLQTEREKSHLYCWLERSKDPFFYISPMKIELLSTNPYLIQVYDVIGDELIADVKNRSVANLERSEVVNYDDPNANDISLVRTSSQTWIPPGDVKHDVRYKNLGKLIEKVTGLTTRKSGSSEDLQVACYGTSHHYEEHLDAVQDPRRTADHGERIATFMLYLSTVEEGGYTSFPVAGTAAKPIKGSAVFWYNLKKNGKPDKRTWHGGCPVTYGIKWVMNLWILEHANLHNRRCSLDKHE